MTSQICANGPERNAIARRINATMVSLGLNNLNFSAHFMILSVVMVIAVLELRSWRKNRGSEDRKIGTAMIGQSLGIRMIGSDISRINTNSTLISIAGTTVTACHRSQQCWFQFRKTTKCFERDKVYILYKRKLLTSNVNQSWKSEN